MIKTITRSLHILNKPNKLPHAWTTSLDLKNCNNKKIKDSKVIKDYVFQLCDLIELKQTGACQVYNFGVDDNPEYSMTQLIEYSSNITLHFSNDNSGYLDIFSSKKYDPIEMVNFTQKFFESDSVVFRSACRY